MSGARGPLEGGDRLIRRALAVGVAGFVLCGIGLMVDPRQALMSYLAAYAAGLGVALGTLILVMMSHVTGAHWFVVLRRLAEAVAGTLPAFAVLFVPVLFGLHHLYPWVPPLQALAQPVREQILQKRAYLNVPFFLARAALYFAVWIALSWLLRHWSVRQDNEPSAQLTKRQRRLSAGGLPAVALTLTFAAFDWLMSLSPEWYSTIYGLYFFAGGFVAALALMAVLALLAQRAGLLSEMVAADHYHALGKLMLTFVIFWAYIAFSQYLIIWIGDVPAEVGWYAIRARGSWGALGVLLAAGHFALPFVILLSSDIKRHPVALAGIGMWLLIMHYLDVYWLVLPQFHTGGIRPHWLDVSALAAVWGSALAWGTWRLRGHAVAPLGDPHLDASLSYGQS